MQLMTLLLAECDAKRRMDVSSFTSAPVPKIVTWLEKREFSERNQREIQELLQAK